MVSSLAIAVSLFIISVTYCLYISFQDLTLEFKDRYSIEVFFDENISEKQAITEFNSILSSTDQIEEGIFIDKTDAANIFKTQFDEDIIEILGENPLPFSAVYTISESYRDYNSIKKIIKDLDIESLSPIEALLKLNQIKKEIEDES